MYKRRIVALFAAVLMLLSVFASSVYATETDPIGEEEETAQKPLRLSVSDDVQEGASLALNETITYTVAIVGNDGGFCQGSFCFLPSDNLEYVSATLFGVDAVLYEEDKEYPDGTPDVFADFGENEELETNGALVLWKTAPFTENYTETNVTLCTVTFRVINVGTASVHFFPYELIDSELEAVEASVEGNDTPHTVAAPEKPVILTETLSDAVMGTAYSAALEADCSEEVVWELTDGALPRGISLSGGTLMGEPEEAGVFTFTVTVAVLDTVSDPVTLTLTVLEKPTKLELIDDSSYVLSDEGLLTGVKALTKLSDLTAQLKDGQSVKVFNGQNEEVTESGALIGTGFTVCLMNGEEKADTATVVILGDVGGDGEIGTNDYYLVRAHYMEKKFLEGPYLTAARIMGEETVGTADYVRILGHYLEKFDLYA